MEVLFNATVAFSIVTGTAALLLAVEARQILRRSPFGTAVWVLAGVMAVFITYHLLLLAFHHDFGPLTGGPPAFLRLFESLLYTGIAAFVWLLIWSQRRLRSGAAPGGEH